MSEQTYRERWRREVFRTALITDSVRVALLALADGMDADGKVSMKREDLAEMIGRHSRKVDERYKAAMSAGYLLRVSRGQKHRPAVYQATLPDRLSATHGGRTEEGVSAPGGGRTEKFSARRFLGVENPDLDNLSAPDGGRTENPAHSKDRAHAHSKTADVGSTTATAEHDDSRRGGVVVRLFDEEIEPSLRSQTPVRASAPAGGEHPAFADWYAAYPIHKARGAAVKAFAKAAKKTDTQTLIAAAKRYRDDPQVIRGYAKHPATWLNQECWLDEIHAHPQAAGEHRPFTNPADQSVYDEDI